MLEILTKQFADALDALSFDFGGTIYNPLDYAGDNHNEYLRKYSHGNTKVLFLGMNPGPHGMVQTGIPFGAITPVKTYLKCTVPVQKPASEHPGRPIIGLSSTRDEVSGLRFWGLIQQRYPDPCDFFRDHLVMNYCPLAFLDPGKTAKNITPDALSDRQTVRKMDEICLEYLREVIRQTGVTTLVGIGRYAEKKLLEARPDLKVCTILHPSPQSPAANRGWAQAAAKQLTELGIWN